jgi:hypothetical protein
MRTKSMIGCDHIGECRYANARVFTGHVHFLEKSQTRYPAVLERTNGRERQ